MSEDIPCPLGYSKHTPHPLLPVQLPSLAKKKKNNKKL